MLLRPLILLVLLLPGLLLPAGAVFGLCACGVEAACEMAAVRPVEPAACCCADPAPADGGEDRNRDAPARCPCGALTVPDEDAPVVLPRPVEDDPALPPPPRIRAPKCLPSGLNALRGEAVAVRPPPGHGRNLPLLL